MLLLFVFCLLLCVAACFCSEFAIVCYRFLSGLISFVWSCCSLSLVFASLFVRVCVFLFPCFSVRFYCLLLLLFVSILFVYLSLFHSTVAYYLAVVCF